MLQETKRLKRLVQDLLELSQAEAPLATLAVEPIFPAPIIQHAVENMAIVHSQFQFSLELDALEGVGITITANHLEQILLILLDNAVKYSTTAKRIDTFSYLADQHVCIVVRDYGMGIPESERVTIFDRFYRVDKARSRQKGGSGLGLSIADRLVKRYRGTISVQSQVGQGTTFTIKLPIAIIRKNPV